MTRSLERLFLHFIVFYCYDQPITKPDHISWWRPAKTSKSLPSSDNHFKISQIITTLFLFTRCGKYKGNGFCGKYVQNENIYFYDMPYQYQLEQTISVSLKGLSISEKCSRYGIPAMCYHLFPVCSHGKKRSRLCQGECTKLKTDICRSEVSLMKKVNENYVKALFPECPNLPRVDTEEGAHCVELGIPRKVVEPVPSKNTTFYSEYYYFYFHYNYL